MTNDSSINTDTPIGRWCAYTAKMLSLMTSNTLSFAMRSSSSSYTREQWQSRLTLLSPRPTPLTAEQTHVWATYINKWHTLLADRAPGMVVRSSNDAADRFMMMIWSSLGDVTKLQSCNLWANEMKHYEHESDVCFQKYDVDVMTLIFLYNKEPESSIIIRWRGEGERSEPPIQGHTISSNALRHISFKLLSLRTLVTWYHANFLSLYTNVLVHFTQT